MSYFKVHVNRKNSRGNMNEVMYYSCNMIRIWIPVFCFITPSYVVNCLEVDPVLFSRRLQYVFGSL